MQTRQRQTFINPAITVATKYFGTITVREEQIITLSQGLLGFPEYHRYIIIEHKKDSPFLWFQCLDNPSLAFVIIDPRLFVADYQVSRLNGCLPELEAESLDDLQIFVIVTIPRGRPLEMTANLLGPLVINIRNRRAKQLVLDTNRYSHRHRIIPQ